MLPWRAAAAPVWPDEGDLATITRTAIDHVGDRLAGGTGDLIWGGDWNCALQGRDCVGTRAGRTALRAVMTTLDLSAPTSDLPHREDGGLCSIDHIAVPNSWTVCTRRRCVAANNGTRLSDHDAYIVEVTM